MSKRYAIMFAAAFLLTIGIFSFFSSTDTSPVVENGAPSSPPPPAGGPPPPGNNGGSTIPPPPGAVSVKPEIVWGDTSKNQVIFTFDGGSGAQSGAAILDTLKKHGVTGTFFLTGKFAEQNPELVKRAANDGHEIFNHTYSHSDLTTLSDAEISQEFGKTEEIIRGLTGKSTKPYFRPPYGARNQRVWAAAAHQGYQSIYWTIDALDWKEDQGFTVEQTKERILTNLKPGTIYMMHIGDTITGRILDEMFTEIKARGYAIVSLGGGI